MLETYEYSDQRAACNAKQFNILAFLRQMYA